MGKSIGRGSEKDHVSITDNEQLVRAIHVIQVMGDSEDGSTLSRLFAKQTHNPRLRGRIKRTGGFVEYQQARV